MQDAYLYTVSNAPYEIMSCRKTGYIKWQKIKPSGHTALDYIRDIGRYLLDSGIAQV